MKERRTAMRGMVRMVWPALFNDQGTARTLSWAPAIASRVCRTCASKVMFGLFGLPARS